MLHKRCDLNTELRLGQVPAHLSGTPSRESAATMQFPRLSATLIGTTFLCLWNLTMEHRSILRLLATGSSGAAGGWVSSAYLRGSAVAGPTSRMTTTTTTSPTSSWDGDANHKNHHELSAAASSFDDMVATRIVLPRSYHKVEFSQQVLNAIATEQHFDSPLLDQDDNETSHFSPTTGTTTDRNNNSNNEALQTQDHDTAISRSSQLQLPTVHVEEESDSVATASHNNDLAHHDDERGTVVALSAAPQHQEDEVEEQSNITIPQRLISDQVHLPEARTVSSNATSVDPLPTITSSLDVRETLYNISDDSTASSIAQGIYGHNEDSSQETSDIELSRQRSQESNNTGGDQSLPVVPVEDATSIQEINPQVNHGSMFKKRLPLELLPIVDVISVGTLRKPQLQETQERTFGSHPSVRNFFRITELNDTDADCYTSLTTEQAQYIESFCGHNHYGAAGEWNDYLRRRIKLFETHTDTPGWVCAQKRPIDGLRIALEHYQRAAAELGGDDADVLSALPNYLIIVDDDTYLNMDNLVQVLVQSHPPTDLYALTTCIFDTPYGIPIVFPYGGFGTTLTTSTIRNLIRPIHCNTTDTSHNTTSSTGDSFTQLACRRIQENRIGEQEFYQEGMSVADLMFSFAEGLPFSNTATWKNGIGFCFHSDHILAYFVSYYHIVVPIEILNDLVAAEESGMFNQTTEDFVIRHGYTTIAGAPTRAQCIYEGDLCNDDALVCHYMNATHMDRMFINGNSSAQM